MSCGRSDCHPAPCYVHARGIEAEVQREVWLFFPGSHKNDSAAVRDEIRRECRRRGWGCMERPAESVRTTSGRPVLRISGRDADGLYRQLHRAHVAVVGVSHAAVYMRPMDPLIRFPRAVVPVRRYTLHKSFFTPLPTSVDSALVWIGNFEHWCMDLDCEGAGDPRCLPLHVFNAQGDEEILFHSEGREQFNTKYGVGVRMAQDGFRWSPPRTALHGREALCVRGALLAQGYHWDVSPGRGKARICTATEEWLVKEYVNIYPNAHVRGTAPYAKRTGPK